MKAGDPGAVAGAFNHYKYYVNISGQEVELTELLALLLKKWKDVLSNA